MLWDWGPVERTLVSAVEALFLARVGELVQAEERARAAVVTAETETDNVWLQGWSNEDLAMVLERAGRIEDAREGSGARAGRLGTEALPAVHESSESAARLARARAGLNHAQGTFPHTRAARRDLPA